MPRLMEIDLALRLPRVSHMIRRLIVRRMRPRRLRRRPPHLQAHRLIDKIHDRPEPPALPRSEILHPLDQPAPRRSFSPSQHPIRSLQRRHPHRNRIGAKPVQVVKAEDGISKVYDQRDLSTITDEPNLGAKPVQVIKAENGLSKVYDQRDLSTTTDEPNLGAKPTAAIVTERD